MRAQMKSNDKELEEMKLSYEEKLKAAQAAAANAGGSNAVAELQKEKKKFPHIYNLNFDPQLSGKVIHILRKPETENTETSMVLAATIFGLHASAHFVS